MDHSTSTKVQCSNTNAFRFALICIASCVSVVGTACNVLLLVIFAAPRVSFTCVDVLFICSKRCGCPFSISPLYLMMLALSDGLLCVHYLLLFGVEVYALYTSTYWLYWLMYQYLVRDVLRSSIRFSNRSLQPTLLYTSRVVQMIIPLWLLFASFERWVSAVACRERSRMHSLRSGTRA